MEEEERAGNGHDGEDFYLGIEPSAAAAAAAAGASEAPESDDGPTNENEVRSDESEPDASGGGDGEKEDASVRGYSSEDDPFGEDLYLNATRVDSFRKAAELLEETHGRPIECLRVSQPWVEFEDVAARDGNAAASFGRFVSALALPRGRPEEQEGRGGRGRAVREIDFEDVEWEEVREEDVERLYRDVLPSHPTLEAVTIDGPSRFASLLVSSIRAGRSPTLRTLRIQCAVDHASAQAVADLVRRNVPLTELVVYPTSGAGLETEDCKLICQSVRRNTHLQVLELRVKEALADTLDDVLADSSLRRLEVSADVFADGCVASVARRLRTNTTLEGLHLRGPIGAGDDDAGLSRFFCPIAEVLETYNVTLRKVTLRWGIPGRTNPVLTGLLHPNRLLRRAVEQHLEPRGYHVSPASLWPRALGAVSALPTLVYRLLRRGDLNALCDLLQPDRAARGTKRGSPPGLRA